MAVVAGAIQTVAATVVVVPVGAAEQAISAAVVANRQIVPRTAREIREDALVVPVAGAVADLVIQLVRVGHVAGRDAAALASGRLRQHGHLSDSVAQSNCLM
jgi:hypothetical protein